MLRRSAGDLGVLVTGRSIADLGVLITGRGVEEEPLLLRSSLRLGVLLCSSLRRGDLGVLTT